MNEPLDEQQIDEILPLLSRISERVRNEILPDRKWLATLLPASAGGAAGQALQELELWIDILQQAKSGDLPDAAAIQLLQGRGIPEAPAVLAVNAVIKPSPPAKPIDRTMKLLQELAKQGSKDVIPSLKLVEALWSALGLEGSLEKYHEWLPDHSWHADIGWYHLPRWMKGNERLLESLLIGRQQVTARYVSYNVVGNRLMRRLHDSVPVHGQIQKPRENYHRRLQDHAWHNDLDWGHLPLWIKGNPNLMDELRRGRQLDGRTISYKMVRNRLMRRLKH